MPASVASPLRHLQEHRGFARFTGVVSYCIGLWNADMVLNKKGCYFTTLLSGLLSVLSPQKAVRDRMEGVPVTDI
jgi:uncharacterized membrane protein YiaA